MVQIPVYSFTGFLDSGKTSFIQETLEDPRFNAGERTLLLCCEQGEAEYDLSKFPKQNVFLEYIEDAEDFKADRLSKLADKYKAERVILEANGMALIGDYYSNLPESWGIAQEVMFADASTIMSYNQNMRSLVVDKLQGCEMVVFNRVPVGLDTMPLHKLARALNRKVDIVYDFTDRSTVFDDVVDPLPFDMDAPVINVEDDDYALFYRDITEESKKYDKKTVRFKAQVAKLKKDRDGMFAPGRFVMTCCEADITFMGIPCKFAGASLLKARSWVTVEARVEVKFHPLYRGIGPILQAVSVSPSEPPLHEVATF